MNHVNTSKKHINHYLLVIESCNRYDYKVMKVKLLLHYKHLKFGESKSITYCGHIFAGELVGGIRNEETSFTYSPIAHYHTFYCLHPIDVQLVKYDSCTLIGSTHDSAGSPIPDYRTQGNS